MESKMIRLPKLPKIKVSRPRIPKIKPASLSKLYKGLTKNIKIKYPKI